MIGIRKVVGFLMALAFALSSSAAFGGDKQYTLVMSPTSGTSPIATMTATFTNKGNSSFNSFTLNVPANYAVTGAITSSRGNVSYSGGVITVVGINLPTGSGQVITVTMSGVTTAGTCGSGVGGSWSAVLWTGSTLSGSTFNQVGPSTTSTSISPACYTVTPSVASSSTGLGTITPNTPQTVAVGGTKVFTLSPITGYNSASVSGTCGGTLVGNTFTTAAVNGNCTVIANFAINVYTVTPSAGANGSISPNTPQPVSHGGTKAFTVAPDTGYHIDVMGGTCGGSLVGNTYTTAAVTGNCSVSATFAKNAYLVSTSVGAGGGSFTPSSQSVLYLDTGAFTVTPDGSHYIGSVTGCGGSLSGNTFTTGPVTAACMVTANFVAKKLAITSAPSSAAVGTPFEVIIGSTPTGADVSFAAGCDASSSKSTLVDGSTKFTITINTLPALPSTCTMTFTSAPDYTPISLNDLQVYKGVLFCGDYDSINGPSDKAYDPDLASSLAGQGSSYVGTPGWGLRRGPNKDGAACVKVNYTCDMTANATTNIVTCTWDKNVVPTQLATFKYLFLWAPRAPQANGWTDYRPQVSWNIASPSATATLPDWVPLLACLSDLFPALPTLPTTILPTIPSVSPFTDTANLPGNGGHAWYQPGQMSLVCGGQQGWTAVGGPGNPLLQIWNIIIDEADLKVAGP